MWLDPSIVILLFSAAPCFPSIWAAEARNVILVPHRPVSAKHLLGPPVSVLSRPAAPVTWAAGGWRKARYGRNSMQLNREELIRAWRDMMTIRRFEERVQEEFSKGGIPGFVHLYAGEEASAVGMCMHLGPKDYIASTHRGHGHSIAKGCDVVGMMCELFARQDGLCGGKGGSMHIADLDQGMLGANGIVGGGPPLVVGAALTAKTLNTGTVAVCFSGDGASNQGTTFEAMNMAVVLKLPAIFVFENNQYGEGTGVGYAGGSHDLAGRAAGFGQRAADRGLCVVLRRERYQRGWVPITSVTVVDWEGRRMKKLVCGTAVAMTLALAFPGPTEAQSPPPVQPGGPPAQTQV